MSMLGRYRKQGGFLQLLNLIETCGPQKQEKLLKLVEDEDPIWSEAIKTKMLSIKKLLSWDQNAIGEIFTRLNDLTVAVVLHGIEPQYQDAIFKMMSQAQKRRILDLHEEKSPTPAEISTIYMQILQEVRKMVDQGHVHLEKIDPTLVVEADIEERLGNGGAARPAVDAQPARATATPATKSVKKVAPEPSAPLDFNEVKKRMAALAQENKDLKEKVAALENMLAQTRKIS